MTTSTNRNLHLNAEPRLNSAEEGVGVGDR